MLSIILKYWKILALLLIVLILFFYVKYYIDKLNTKNQILIESNAIKSLEQINEAENNVVNKTNITNEIRNKNYNSLSNDELREKIIKGVSNLKFKK